MLNACGMVIDDTMPSVIGFLDKNVRISVDKMPIVDPEVGINASIRIVNQQTVSEEKLLDSGSTTAEMLHFLTACIRYRITIRGWEKMLTAATAAVPSDETISRSDVYKRQGNLQCFLELLIDHLDLPLIVYDTDARINVTDDALGNKFCVGCLAQLMVGYFQKLHKLVDII